MPYFSAIRSRRSSVSWKLVARLEVEDVGLRGDLGEHGQNHAPLGTEGRGHRQIRRVSLDAPGDDLFRRGRFQPLAGLPARPAVPASAPAAESRPTAWGGRAAVVDWDPTRWCQTWQASMG